MQKTILVAFMLFFTGFAQAASISCVGKEATPSLKAQNLQINLHEVFMENVEFELNNYIGSSRRLTQGKLDEEKQVRIFDVSTLGMYDRSTFELDTTAMSKILRGASSFSAVIRVQKSGTSKIQATPVTCEVGR